MYNAVEFLRDPDYQCRRPRHQVYFETIFNVVPFEKRDCDWQLGVVAHPAYSSLINIDPARVYRIDLIAVGGGDELFTRFGHLSFKLNMCKPGQALSESCLRNKSHHIAVSFRLLDDGTRDLKKTVFGGFKTVMQVERFLSLKSDYYNTNQNYICTRWSLIKKTLQQSQITRATHPRFLGKLLGASL